LLGLENGTVRVENGLTVIGDFGFSKGVTANTNKRLGKDFAGKWSGTAYVHSLVSSFDSDPNYKPIGGIVTNAIEDARLDQANKDALAHSLWVASLPATGNLGAVQDTSIDLGSIDGLRTVHVIEVASLLMKNDALTLTGDAADVFVFNVRGNFQFDASEVRLVGGISAGHVLFNFPQAGKYTSNVVIGRSATSFQGTILAPDLGSQKIEYRYPGTFRGAIIAKRIDVHSEFILVHEPFTGLVCLCVGPSAAVVDELPSCNSPMDPRLGATLPVISQVSEISLTSEFPAALVMLVGSIGIPTPFVFPGTACTIHVDLAQASVLSTSLTDAGGSWSLGMQIPSGCSYVGLHLALQAAIVDGQAQGPIPGWLSNGVLLTIGLP
jgi:choice-of-anchor A domain-containing protein